MGDTANAILGILALVGLFFVVKKVIPNLVAGFSKRVFYSAEAAEIKLFCDESLTFQTSATPSEIADSIRRHVTTHSDVALVGPTVVLACKDNLITFVGKSAWQVLFAAGIAWEEVDGHRRVAWQVAQWREVNGRAMGLPLLRRLRQEVITAMEELPGPNGEPHAIVGGLEAEAISAAAAGSANAPVDPLSVEASKARERTLGPMQWWALGVGALGLILFYFDANALGWVALGGAVVIFFLADRAGKMALKAQADPNATPPPPPAAAVPPMPTAPFGSALMAPPVPPTLAPAAPPVPAPAVAADVAVSTAAFADVAAPATLPVNAGGRRFSPAIIVVGVAIAVLAVGIIATALSNRAADSTAEQTSPAQASLVPANDGIVDDAAATGSDSGTDADSVSAAGGMASLVVYHGSGQGSLFDLPTGDNYRTVELVGISADDAGNPPTIEAEKRTPTTEKYTLNLTEDWLYYVNGEITNRAMFAAVVANGNAPLAMTLYGEGVVSISANSDTGSAQQMEPPAKHIAMLEDVLSLAPSDGSEKSWPVVIRPASSDDEAIDFYFIDGGKTYPAEIPEGDLGSTTVDGSDADHARFFEIASQEKTSHLGTLTITKSGVSAFDVMTDLAGGD